MSKIATLCLTLVLSVLQSIADSDLELKPALRTAIATACAILRCLLNDSSDVSRLSAHCDTLKSLDYEANSSQGNSVC